MHNGMALCVAPSYMYFLEYARATLITGMKAENFQKTRGFELCSGVSLSDFIDKNDTEQKACGSVIKSFDHFAKLINTSGITRRFEEFDFK